MGVRHRSADSGEPVARRTLRILIDERGVSALELGLIAPFLLMLFLGIVDLARGYSEVHALQEAASRAIEMAQARGNSSDTTYLIPDAAAAAGVPERNVTVRAWTECDGVLSPNGECPAGQQVGQYNKLTITSSYRPMFGTVGYGRSNPDGTIPISASATLRTL